MTTAPPTPLSPELYPYTLFFTVEDPELYKKYEEKVNQHNTKVATSKTPDSGFDLLFPCNGSDEGYGKHMVTPPQEVAKTPPAESTTASQNIYYGGTGPRGLYLGVKCAMYKTVAQTHTIPTGFYLYPRSSICKTPFRMSNSLGIIDAGYRGELIAAVDLQSEMATKSSDAWMNWKLALGTIKKHDRMFQICSPDLSPFTVHLIDALDNTERGTGGHGSTGN
jgi:dUTPase